MGNKVKFIGCIGKYVENSWVLFVESKHGNGAIGMSNSDETSTVKYVHGLSGKQEWVVMGQYAIDFILVGLPEIEADVFKVRKRRLKKQDDLNSVDFFPVAGGEWG